MLRIDDLHTALGASRLRLNCSKVPFNGNTSSVTALPPWRAMLPAAVLTLIMLLAQLLPEIYQLMLRYDRLALADGEYWRLLTANIIHLGWGHFGLNVAGLWLIVWLYAADRSCLDWLVGLLITGFATSWGVHLFSGDIFWMLGLSGALHGLFVLGAIGLIMAGDGFGWGLLLGVGGKLAFEQFAGEVPFTAAIVGGSVVTDAHLWGSMGGVVAASLEYLRWRRSKPSL